MGVVCQLEDEGRLLTLTVDQAVNVETLEAVHLELSRHLTKDVNQLLILRQEADAAYEIETGMDFGERFGNLLAGTGIVVAVVRGGEHREDVAIDAMIFNKGVALAEFDDEHEARAWLSLKAN